MCTHAFLVLVIINVHQKLMLLFKDFNSSLNLIMHTMLPAYFLHSTLVTLSSFPYKCINLFQLPLCLSTYVCIFSFIHLISSTYHNLIPSSFWNSSSLLLIYVSYIPSRNIYQLPVGSWLSSESKACQSHLSAELHNLPVHVMNCRGGKVVAVSYILQCKTKYIRWPAKFHS